MGGWVSGLYLLSFCVLHNTNVISLGMSEGGSNFQACKYELIQLLLVIDVSLLG